MEPHQQIILLLCVLGVLKEFRPSEPFFTPFLNGPKNFTETEVNNDIYPVGTYSNMSLLIVIFLLTDWFRYKPIILLQGVSGLVTWSLLVCGQGLAVIQIAEVFYGLYSSCDVAFSSYLYAKIDKSHYSKATAQTKAALLIGKTGSGLIGQLLVLYHVMDYLELNYLTLAGLLLLTTIASFLPPVTNEQTQGDQVKELKELAAKIDPKCGEILPEERGSLLEIAEPENQRTQASSFSLSKVFGAWRGAIKERNTLKWSVWAVFSMCLNLQVSYYVQVLWQTMIITARKDEVYHGFSNTFNSLAGAVCTYAVGLLVVDWTKYGEITLAVTSVVQGSLLVLSSYLTEGLLAHYAIYAGFKVLYNVSNCIVSAEIAKTLKSEGYGVVFGANQFFALVAQSILTFLVTKVFFLDIRMHFLLCAGLFLALGFGFAISGVYTLCHFRKRTELNVGNELG